MGLVRKFYLGKQGIFFQKGAQDYSPGGKGSVAQGSRSGGGLPVGSERKDPEPGEESQKSQASGRESASEAHGDSTRQGPARAPGQCGWGTTGTHSSLSVHHETATPLPGGFRGGTARQVRVPAGMCPPCQVSCSPWQAALTGTPPAFWRKGLLRTAGAAMRSGSRGENRARFHLPGSCLPPASPPATPCRGLR